MIVLQNPVQVKTLIKTKIVFLRPLCNDLFKR